MNQIEELNQAQTEAVTNCEGPMMIIAGAGTGKTKVITTRIAHLINSVEVKPESILALTFTEKAADEMTERVDKIMPLSYEGAQISTFHSFCDVVLRESAFHIGIDPSFKIMNQAKQWLLINKNLFELGLDRFRPLGNPAKFIHVLINFFSRLKDEDVTTEKFINFANEKSAAAFGDDEKEEAAKLTELANAYDAYQKIKLKQNLLDFGDLQYYVLRLFEQSPAILSSYRKRFKYILVDEYQDTNYAQNKIVTMLALEHKNLTVVGDDDQSIYKWRGASLSNLVSFEKNFPRCKKVILNENYRSGQKILDLSYNLIQNNNPDRLEARESIDKKLVFKGESDSSHIMLSHFNHYFEELESVTSQILTLSNKGVEYGDIAILVRANQHGHAYIDELKRLNIPYSVRDTQSLGRFEEIKDLIALLNFLARPHNNVAAVRLLEIPLFGIPMEEILDISNEAKRDDYKPIYYYLRDKFKQGTIPLGDSTDRVESVYNLLTDMLNFSKRHPVSRMIGEFLDKSGYYKDLKLDENKNAEKIQRIAQLIEIAYEFELENNDNRVDVFLEYLDSMEQAGGLISRAELHDANAVSILTVHSAKGLEFDYVFMPSLVAQRFPATSRKEPIEIPSDLIEEDIGEETSNLAEERRLFYVACTRARKGLFFSYSDKYEGNKKWKISPFLKEVLESGIAEVSETPAIEKVDYEHYHRGLIVVNVETEMDEKMAYVPDINVNQLSYSKIEAFKTCPLKYKFRYIFQIPTPTPHAANFGSSVHNTVNIFYNRIKEGESPSLDLLRDVYDKCWIGTGYMNKAHENTRKEKGWEMMEKFYQFESNRNFKVPAFMERNFRLKMGEVAFSGRIDRIDKLEDGSYEVVDYKTGSSKKNIKLDKDLQLSLYALACKEIFGIRVSKLSLFYLEDCSKASTTRSEGDMDTIRAELVEAANAIKASDFTASPGFPCGFCEYKVLCNKAV